MDSFMKDREYFWAYIFVTIFYLIASNQCAGQTFTAKDGTDIHYQITGDGAPVILVHGYMSNIDHMWERVIPTLEENYRVIAIDIRGHGRSDKPDSSDSYGLNMGRDIIELMDFLEIDQAHLVGYSMGAMIGMKLAVEYPEKLLSFISGGSGIYEKDVIDSISDNYTQKLSQFNSIEEALNNGLFSVSGEILKHFHTHLKHNDVQVMVDVVNSLEEFAMTRQEAETISIPIAVIIGEYDSSIPAVVKLFESNPATRIIPIPDKHHLDLFYDPEFAIQVKRFLDDIELIIDSNT